MGRGRLPGVQSGSPAGEAARFDWSDHACREQRRAAPQNAAPERRVAAVIGRFMHHPQRCGTTLCKCRGVPCLFAARKSRWPEARLGLLGVAKR